jgi:hypothetical protein
MPVPEYLIYQEEEYIKSRGYTFKDFSAEQILTVLEMEKIFEKVKQENPFWHKWSEAIYKKQGYVKVKSTGIIGGEMWIKKK